MKSPIYRHVTALQLSKMAASAGWNDDKEEQLAAMWEEREFLYNHNVKGYNNRAKKDTAIREIAFAIDIPGKSDAATTTRFESRNKHVGQDRRFVVVACSCIHGLGGWFVYNTCHDEDATAKGK